MAKIEPMTFEPSEPWIRARSDHVSISTNRIEREELELATKRDEDGDTFLHVAVAKGNEPACRKLVEILKSRNLSIDVRNNVMQTPLHVACITDHPAIAALLLSADPTACDVTDRHGNNSVHLAIKHSRASTQHLTLRAVINAASLGALEKKNIYGLAPIHLAAIEGNHQGIRLLKKAGADINLLENKGGASPIILATRTSQREAAQALLELGANPNLRTTYGESASQLASAKGDHVISELLALYDSPYDVTKHSALPRYINSGYGSTGDMAKQGIPPRNQDVKMKPFVNSRLANGNPFTSSLPQATSSVTAQTSSSRNEPLRVKSERKSPASAFPSNHRKQSEVAVSKGQESSNQPLNFVVRKPPPAPVTSQHSKRKLDENEPLDLSNKRLKSSPKPNHADSSKPLHTSQPNGPSRDDSYVFVHPLQQPTPVRFPQQVYYKVVPHPHPVANHIPVNVAVPLNQPRSELPSGYQPITRHAIDPRSFNAPISSRHAVDLQHYVHYAKSEFGPPRQPHDPRHSGQRIPVNHNEPRHHEQPMGAGFVEMSRSDQPIRKVTSEKRVKVQPMADTNGMSNQIQPILKRVAGSRDVHPVHEKSRSSRKPSSESRDKYQPTTKHPVEIRHPAHPIPNRSEESRDRPFPTRQHSHLGHMQSLPITLHSPALPADDHSITGSSTSRERQNSLNHERRYQSDDRYHVNAIPQPIGKQSIVRRNSAPVPAKVGGDKLELRSYTGCLPPHFLHLLESSGNLPIKPSNALRNVADMLRDDVTPNDVTPHDVTVKQETPEIVKEPKASTANVIRPKALTKAQVTSSVASLLKATSIITSPLKNVRIISEAESPPAPPSNHFANLGEWESIEAGEYPAFGKLQKLVRNDKTIVTPLGWLAAPREFRLDEKYITNPTRALLKSVEKTKPSIKVIPPLPWGFSVGKPHACSGCSNHKKDVPRLIEDIWQYKPESKYVTSPLTTPPEIVYCSRPNPPKAPRHRTPTPPQSTSDLISSTSSSTEDVKTAPSSPDVRSPKKTKTDSNRRTSLDEKLRELRQKAIVRQSDVRESVTSNHRKGGSNDVNEDDVNDDILANSIEDSSDEEQDNEPTMKRHVMPVNGVAIRNGDITTASNGFHGNFQTIKNTLLKNIELQSEIYKKIQSVSRAIVSHGNRVEVEKEIRLSDLEISDDEDDRAAEKIG